MKQLQRRILLLIMISGISTGVQAQKFLSDLDTALLYLNDSVHPVISHFDNIRFSGYIQPQFQVAESKGVDSWNGGDFSENASSRFMLRRARVKLEYILATKDNYPRGLFAFQVDATERGVNVRDMFLKMYETKKNNFALTAGLFARPFGFELNYSSQYRETPERGRISQILMPTERDLGAMITYEPLRREAKNKLFKFDIGVFNGQGLAGTREFDSFKDLISRLTFKPQKLGDITLSGGLSLLYGGWRQATKYVFELGDVNGATAFVVDSAVSNLGEKAPRHYHGADMQMVWDHGWGETELRAEYWFGTQPGTAISTFNPGTDPEIDGQPADTYIRKFDGAFFYLLQHIVNRRHQIVIKYDWYDPNRKVTNLEVGGPGSNLSSADLKFSTLVAGYNYQANENLRVMIFYDFITNKESQLPGYTEDLADNIFTCRLHFLF